MRETGHAPAPLELVQEFVNTLDVEEHTDALADSAGASAWLASRGLAPDRGELSEDNRERLIAAREALREMLLANNTGEPTPDSAVATINGLARDAPLRLRLDGSGADLLPDAEGISRAVGELLAAVHAGITGGNWLRLKACPAEDCRWAFYDRSRNRAATWCEMGECGNRSKARAYRARHRSDD